MNDDLAIKVDHVSKNFKLPHEKTSSVKSVFVNLFHNIQNKRTYAVQHALRDIDFEIKKGEFFGIVGRNGSGKSTLLKILAGIYQPTTGSVTVHGKLVPFIELGVGFNPELTGRENVFLNGALLGFSQQQVEAMYDEIVGFAELEKFMDQKLKNYSSGMQVRLAFSMAIRAEADILLVDEVLAVGDADFQRKCFDYFKKLKKDKKTVVFVSHDMNSVREYCDRALLIDQSKIISEGNASRVAGEYAKLFLAKRDTGTGEGRTDLTRWGEGPARIVDPKIATRDGRLELSFSVSTEKEVDDLIIGYYFLNESGQQICGTNTQLLDIKLKPFLKGKNQEIVFTMDDILSDGRHTATIALLRNSGATISDWWEEAAEINIKRAQHTPYLVDAPVNFSLRGTDGANQK